LAGSNRPQLDPVRAWLGSSQLGLAVMAIVAGIGGGFGAVVFRYMIYSFTWIATGHSSFGQQGRVPSAHLPWLGLAFLLVIPMIGGLIYGPLIYRFAREARGHGVPEVMLAVAEEGGKIRPQVTVVKALASALCIGSGGSVGREGPIVQIGSALASSLGQLVRMNRDRLRILVACGAAAGISATFNAPVTGLFFGFEIILRTFSIDALFACMVSSVLADLISREFFGPTPFFTGFPHDLSIHHLYTYLLVAVLGAIGALLGVGFKTVLYKIEDLCDAVWKPRPEWARPAVMGLSLGVLLLVLPQMYGVGYPVMDQALSGKVVVWLLILFTVGKMVATSLSIGIGGSGGIFAPSLFIGTMGGTAFGYAVEHVLGTAAGPPAMYGMVAMGAVFAAAARAPLTSIASVTEMTGDFALTLPVMLAVGIATAISRRMTYGTIYTTKLLRRGIDIDAEGKAAGALHLVAVADVMRPLAHAGDERRPLIRAGGNAAADEPVGAAAEAPAPAASESPLSEVAQPAPHPGPSRTADGRPVTNR
jgi:CIC family chloride channel protein